MEKPPIWQMILQAINAIGGIVKYQEIKNYINENWEDVNQDTITTQIIALSVNHDSRGHYPENRNARLTNSQSPYDILYRLDRGLVTKYNQNEHGIWEVYINADLKPSVRQFSGPTKTYTPSDIIWIKNVTNKVTGEAYLDLTQDTFILDFPTKHKTNVLSPEVDEIILIRQKVNGIPAFTHLVTPIDNIRHERGERDNYQFGRRVKVIAKTGNQDFFPIKTTEWKRVKSTGFLNGNVCKISNLDEIGNYDDLLMDIWTRFSGHFVEAEKGSQLITSAILAEISNVDPNLTVIEGELKLVSHFVKERNQKIVAEKKRKAIENNALKCEVCTFSFPNVYGANFIECHHIVPINQTGIRETKLEDLALVCSNCHRMLHIKFEGDYLSMKQLQDKMENK